MSISFIEDADLSVGNERDRHLTSDAGGRHRGEPPRKTFIAGRTTAAVGDRHAQATVGIHRTIRTP